MDHRTTFASQEEEIQYWKNRVVNLEKEAKDAKEEFQEFQEGSRELEHELETQLEQSEAKIKEFRSLTNRLQQENDQLKDKVEQCHKEYNFQVSPPLHCNIPLLITTTVVHNGNLPVDPNYGNKNCLKKVQYFCHIKVDSFYNFIGQQK
jgi:SMC interacting uncharacterized protein involved in chromosome segregation